MGLLSKLKRALKTKDDKKNKNLKTYRDNPMLKTEKKGSSSSKSKTKEKTYSVDNPHPTIKQKKESRQNLPSYSASVQGKKNTASSRIDTAKYLFDKDGKKSADRLGVEYRGKGSQHYKNTRSKSINGSKDKTDTTKDTPYQKYQYNYSKDLYSKAEAAYKSGDIATGNKYASKAEEHAKKYQTSKNAPKARSLTSNEALLLQTLGLSGSPEYTQKGLTAAQQTYANGNKNAEYGDIKGKIKTNYEHDLNVTPFVSGVEQGISWVPISRVIEKTTGYDNLNLDGAKTGFYTAGKVVGMLGQGLTTGGVVKAATAGTKLAGRAGQGLMNALVDVPINAVDAVDYAEIQKSRGLDIPASVKNLTNAQSTGGAPMTQGLEPGGSADEARLFTASIDNWNNDLVAQAWEEAGKNNTQPIFGLDKNNRLHYAFTEEDLAQIIEYYDNYENPTYTLSSTGRKYVDSDRMRFIRNMALNTGLSFGAGAILGKSTKALKGTDEAVQTGTKELVDTAEKVAPKAAEEATETTAKTTAKSTEKKIRVTEPKKTTVKEPANRLPVSEPRKVPEKIDRKAQVGEPKKVTVKELPNKTDREKLLSDIREYKNGRAVFEKNTKVVTDVDGNTAIYKGTNGKGEGKFEIRYADGTVKKTGTIDDVENLVKNARTENASKVSAEDFRLTEKTKPKDKLSKKVYNKRQYDVKAGELPTPAKGRPAITVEETTDYAKSINAHYFKNKVKNASPNDVIRKFKDGSVVKFTGTKEVNGELKEVFTVIRRDGKTIENVAYDDIAKTLELPKGVKMPPKRPKTEFKTTDRTVRKVNAKQETPATRIRESTNQERAREAKNAFAKNERDTLLVKRPKKGEEKTFAKNDRKPVFKPSQELRQPEGTPVWLRTKEAKNAVKGKTYNVRSGIHQKKQLNPVKGQNVVNKSEIRTVVKKAESPKVASKAEAPKIEPKKELTMTHPTTGEIKTAVKTPKMDANPKIAKAEAPKKIGNFEVTEAPKKAPKKAELSNGDKVKSYINEKITAAKQNARDLYRYLVSSQAPIERMAKDTGNKQVVERMQAVRNAHASTAFAYHHGVVSLDKAKIIRDKGFKEAFVVDGKRIKGKELEKLNDAATHLHNIDRSKQFTYTFTKSNGSEVSIQATDWTDAVAKFKEKHIDITKLEDAENADFIKFRDNKFDGETGEWKNLTVESKAVWRQVSAEDSQKIVDELLKENPRLGKAIKQIQEWWEDFAHVNLVEAGFMNEKQFTQMRKMYPNYVPTYRDKNRPTGLFPIKQATGGHSAVEPIEDQFLKEIDRMIRLTRKNEMNAEFIKELQANPEKTAIYGKIHSVEAANGNHPEVLFDELDALDRNAVKQINKDSYLISAYINGEKVTASVSKEVSDAFKMLDNAYGWEGLEKFGKIGRFFTNPMKTWITTANPLFGISNIARDLPTSLIQSEYSMGKTITGYGKALAAMVSSRTGSNNAYKQMYEMYKALGGESAGFVNVEKGFEKSIKGGNMAQTFWKGVKDTLSFVGEHGETVPRLAEFINTIEKYGMTPEAYTKALNAAAEVTVNFSRSGALTKGFDSWILYLNATVQGLDKFVRTFKAHPVRTIGRSTTLISAPFLALTAYNWDNPHYQAMSDRNKANYFLVPNIAGEKDENGKCMTFIKVPLNREYGTIFGTSLNMAFTMMNEGDIQSVKEQMMASIKTNFMPQSPTTDNIFAPLRVNLPNNRNFAGMPIVPAKYEDASPINQHDAKTSDIAMAIASFVNKHFDGEHDKDSLIEYLKSPMKVDYMIDSYGGYLGAMLQSLGTKEEKKLGVWLMETYGNQISDRFLGDPRFSSKDITDFYDAVDAASRAKTDADLTGENVEYAKYMNTLYTNASKTMTEMSKAEKQLLEYDALTDKEKKKAAQAAFDLIDDGVIKADTLTQLKNRKGNLTDKDIDTIIKGLRSSKINVAKMTKLDVAAFEKEYKANPTYAVLSDEVKAEYDESYGSKEDYAKVYNLSKSANGTFAKAAIAIKHGLSTEAAYAMSGSSSKEENFAEQVEWANYVASSGINITKTSKLKTKADYNNSGRVNEDEAVSYINKNFPMATRKEKAAMFYVICNTSSRKHNPYL